MLRIFKKTADNDVVADDKALALQPKAVREVIVRTTEENPYVHQRITGRELHANIVEALRAEPDGRAETALGVMASLAGFSCLSAVHNKYERGEISPDQDGFGIHVTQTGRRIFYGRLVEEKLFEGEMSLWGMVRATSKKLGAMSMPDMEDISQHVETSCETDDYGVPRVPAAHQPRDLPSNFVRYLMPSYLPLLQQYDADADKFPISFGFAIQNLMEENCEVLDPAMAAKIVMECAVPMASLDPAAVF